MIARRRNPNMARPRGLSQGGVQRYYLTRDSNTDGTLCEGIDVWLTAPLRHRMTAEGGYVWVPSDERTYRSTNHGRALYQQITVDECMRRFAAVPTSDAVRLLLLEVAP